MKRRDVNDDDDFEEDEPPIRRSRALSRPLVPNDDVHGIRKPRSLLRENVLYFAVFIPMALVAGGIIYFIIWLVQ